MKVFISWSGQKSAKVALVFKNWLPNVIQDISEKDIFVSSEDIDKGSNWNAELVKELENDNFGILCITRENIVAPWIMFEAGALSKFSQESRVCPFLYDLTKEEVKNNPLSQFQITQFDKEDILKLLKSLNKKIDKPLSDIKLTNSFHKFYTELEKELNEIKSITSTAIYKKCEFHETLESAKLAIEQELTEIKIKGITKIFRNQRDAISDYRKNHNISNISTTKILCIRGENFILEEDEHWGSIIPTDSIKTTILGDSADEDMITNRYEAHKLPNERIVNFKERYKLQMKNTQDIIRTYPNNTLFLHNETDLPFRMLFIDDYLFLSTFPKNLKASQAEILKIPNSSTLYAVCEEYYNKVKSIARQQ